MQEKSIILNTAYNPPMEYFYYLLKYENAKIEYFENFQKQSYRNRCQILGPNGKQALSVPITKNGQKKVHTKDIDILYAEDWVKEHISSIEAAYSSSPYFIHYSDELFEILRGGHEKLVGLNRCLLDFFLKKIKINANISETADYIHEYGNETLDLRDKIHPKKKSDFKIKPYFQVFNDRFEFVNNLSILDGLFNLGPELILYLED